MPRSYTHNPTMAATRLTAERGHCCFRIPRINVPTAIKKSIPYGRHTLTLETGEIARQAGGAVLVSLDDTVVLVTVVAAKQCQAGTGLLPADRRLPGKDLRRRKIPGGFFKREGRPSEKETLTSRLIDRPIRPLFPDGFYNEVQVDRDGDVGRSRNRSRHSRADRRVGGARRCRAFRSTVRSARRASATSTASTCSIRPRPSSTTSKLNLVVAGTEAAVLMVESEANELPEEVMLGAVVFGHQQSRR